MLAGSEKSFNRGEIVCKLDPFVRAINKLLCENGRKEYGQGLWLKMWEENVKGLVFEADVFDPLVGARYFAVFKNALPTIVRMERYLEFIHWRALTKTKVGECRLSQAIIEGYADAETRLQLLAGSLVGQEVLLPILCIMKKREITERVTEGGKKLKANLGRMNIQDATKFYLSIEECMTRWSKDATPVLDGTEHVLWFDRISHSKVTKSMVKELRAMVKEGSEVRAELKSLLEKMFLGGLVLWKSHTEEHREGGKLNILDKWQSVKAAVLHADDDESESVHGMKKMRSLKNPSEGQNSANFRMMWARNKTSQSECHFPTLYTYISLRWIYISSLSHSLYMYIIAVNIYIITFSLSISSLSHSIYIYVYISCTDLHTQLRMQF